MNIAAILLLSALAGSDTPAAAPAGQAYVRREDTQWVMGTAMVERIVSLDDGKFVLKSFKNRKTGREIIPTGAASDEFSLSTGEPAERLTGKSGGWQFVDAKQTTLTQGEVQLDITLRRNALEITKTYALYPGSSVIREWVTVKNAGDTPLKVIEPGFLDIGAALGEPGELDFHWMTGGENHVDSWLLKTEKLDPAKARTFDSYEAFPAPPTATPGDGIDAKILRNDRQIWPATGWQFVASSSVTVPFDLTTDVMPNDWIVFLVNMHGNIGYDTTAFDPTITYVDGERHIASKEFTSEQGRNGWRYQYIENGKFVDLVWYPGPKQWRKEKDNPTGTPFVSLDSLHPDVGQDAVRVWTAPKAGRVRLTGSVCNTGNPGPGAYGFRMGSSSYAPWYGLYNRGTRNGLFIGFDYFGHWASSVRLDAHGTVTAQLKVAGHKQTLAPGESVTTPKAFVGLFADDLDNAGNELLDWQYRYLWDYTREGWFPAIRMLGYWMKGTGWGQSGVSWTGGNPDLESAFRKVFRVADLMRYVGADVYHRDWGWWDRAGDWNGPDFRATIDYLRKHGMGQLIYAFLYTVDAQSKVAQDHPDWVIGNTLDMSRPEVVHFMKGQLDGFVERWGPFEWRNDSTPTCPRNGDDTPLLGQDAGLREVIRGFLDNHPECAFQAVNGGGNDAGYDYTHYASTLSFSDGAVGIRRNYYASLLFPPDKTSDIPDVWDPNKYDKATWRGLLCINFDMTGDTWDPAKLEGIRELIDIYHYLQTKGLVGRWVHVYRPTITGDDPTMYLQRLSRDGLRGLIIPKRPPTGPVTIRPRGLLPDETYAVSFHESTTVRTASAPVLHSSQSERGSESAEGQKRTGRDLMDKGVTLERMAPGELIYLNLPLHPGSKLDTTPPQPPGRVAKRWAENMGYPGVELAWSAGSDDNWLSYYEVLRDGVLIDKVAKGTFYFDHSAGADAAATYEIRTVDGAGNPSAKAAAQQPTGPRCTVIDDAGNMTFTGQWKHDRNLQPAHAGTISAADTKGATCEVTLEGRKVLWFSKLGADCGKAAVSIDGSPAEVVDTYSADDIWGVCVFRKDFSQAGRHALRIEVLGEHTPRATANVVHVDGVRAEP